MLSVLLGPLISQTCNPETENQIFNVMSDDAKLKENFYVQSVILLKLEDGNKLERTCVSQPKR